MLVNVLTLNTAKVATPKQAKESLKSLLLNRKQENAVPDIVLLALQEVAWFHDRSRLDTGLVAPPAMYKRFLAIMPRAFVPLLSLICWLYFAYESVVFRMLKLAFPDNTTVPGKFLYKLFSPLTNASTCAKIYAEAWESLLLDMLNDEYDKDFSGSYDMDYVLYGSNAIILLHRRDCNLTIVSKDAVGFGHINLPNKGAVCIRTMFQDRLIDFIGVHLAANEGYYDRRNRNFVTTLSSLQQKPAHATIFVGDTNYRLNITRPEYERKFGFEWLDINDGFALDELSLSLESHPIISQFEEARVNFPASFKLKSSAPVERLGSRFTLSSYAFETRLPAWCDRILYHQTSALKVTCVDYCNNLIYAWSDHLPVGATLEIDPVPIVSRPKPLASYSRFSPLLQLVVFILTIVLVQSYRYLKVLGLMSVLYLLHWWWSSRELSESFVKIHVLL